MTHEGVEVAVKVQRPDAMAVLAKDYMCFVVTWAAIDLYWRLTPGGFDNGDIASVIRRVATDILDELGVPARTVLSSIAPAHSVACISSCSRLC